MNIGQAQNAKITGATTFTGPLLSARSLLCTADNLRCTLNRIDSLSDRVRGVLFGYGPDPKEGLCRAEPQSLEDMLLSALETADVIEKNLHGILEKLSMD